MTFLSPKAYGAQFVQKIQQKHTLAQSYFSHMPEMAREMKKLVKKLPLPQSREKTVIVTMGNHEEAKTAEPLAS